MFKSVVSAMALGKNRVSLGSRSCLLLGLWLVTAAGLPADLHGEG